MELGSVDVARELYPIALKQARAEVMIDVGALLVLTAAAFMASVPFLYPVIAGGAISTIVDIRWWVWLRDAVPEAAYPRIEAHTDDSQRIRLLQGAVLAAVVLLSWWFRGIMRT